MSVRSVREGGRPRKHTLNFTKLELKVEYAYIQVQMSSDFKSFLIYLGALSIVGVLFFLLPTSESSPPPTKDSSENQVASVVTAKEAVPLESPAEVENIPVAPALEEPSRERAVFSETKPPQDDQKIHSSVVRIQAPYPFPPLPFLTVNEQTRAALVNIYCSTDGGILQSTSGSGVIIDPRGIILTNAHVAQYVLLSEDGRINLSCTIRSGAPARPTWKAEVIYIPPVWVQEHAPEITKTDPLGVGKHDYALLRITGTLDQSTRLPDFPHLPIDTREAIGFPRDSVLTASYPAEFVGAASTNFGLNPASSLTTIKELLTFVGDTVDLISLGGVAEAQSGSSGGAVVNEWGYLVGIITTTSDGATTADRELRALTLSYINREILNGTGMNLEALLVGGPAKMSLDFRAQNQALEQLLFSEIEKVEAR